MTEEEALIRAIVNNPGEDTPRLVYADWLDDHDDPRSVYLRAESEWAKPWREGHRPTDTETLKEMASKFDQVWVARVSRPPLGVCCDHVEFAKIGPKLTEEEVASIEKWPGVRLPTDYRAFLLNYNGGVPQFIREPIPPTDGSICVSVTQFYPYDPRVEFRTENTLQGQVERYWRTRLPRYFEYEPHNAGPDEILWYQSYIPVADVPDDIFTVLLGIDGDHLGRVQLIDWSVEATTYEGSTYKRLADNFSVFLHRLQRA